MKVFQHERRLRTSGGLSVRDITHEVAEAVRESGVRDGIVCVYSPHTTCCVRVNEFEPTRDNDMQRLETLRAEAVDYLVRNFGFRIPDDVAVVGFDDHALAVQVRPALTTVRQPVELMGATAVQGLLAAAGGELPGESATVLPTELIVRDSA